MKYLSLFFLITIAHSSFGQEVNLLSHKKFFDLELKQWTKSFDNFNLADFKIEDTLHFDNNFPQDFNSYNEFLLVYKPIITYIPDSSKFIDIYSYQLNLDKKENYYEANPDIDQAILLCDVKNKYWNRIYFGTNSQWIDEVTWVSKTKFILAGINKSVDDKKSPFLLYGDADKQIFIKYFCSNKNIFQDDVSYLSPKLKKIHIKGL